MIPRPLRIGAASYALAVSVSLSGVAVADPVNSILLRSADGAPRGLGPTRLKGDFGEHLDLLTASQTVAAVTDSAAGLPSASSLDPAETQPDVVLPVIGGVVGGAAGLYGGAIIGLALNEHDSGELDVLAAAGVGALLGEALLLPLGVHLGNARKGSYATDLGVSVLGGLAGLGAFSLAGGSTQGVILGAGLQLVLVVIAERRKGRERIARRRSTGMP